MTADKKSLDNIRTQLILELESGIDELAIMTNMAKRDNPDKDRNADRHVLLKSLHRKIANCKKCSLYKTRTNVVFGEGNPYAALMFVGEAPGQDEDAQARPFVGRAGQLLTKIIEAMGLKREDVYIGNCLKCRPPNNRNPLPEELEACWPHIKEQIGVIRPKVICALGKFAAYDVLKLDSPITKSRGNFYEYKNTLNSNVEDATSGAIKVMPTFHPAYLLRNPSEKRKVWEDMKKILKELNLKIPHR